MSGIFGQLAGSLLGNPAVTQALPGILNQLMGPGQAGGLGGLLQQLEAAGLGEQVSSWVGQGANKSVAPEQLGQALPPEQVQSMAQQAGTTPEELLQLLAHALPHAVDHATPDGVVPNQAPAQEDIAGMIGRLFSR